MAAAAEAEAGAGADGGEEANSLKANNKLIIRHLNEVSALFSCI